MNASTPVAATDPLMMAWKAYQQTEDYANTLNWWGKEHQPPEGTLWAAFMAGFRASHPEAEFILTREGKIGVGYSNKTEEGGFTVLKWLPDELVKDSGHRDGLIRIHPAHWDAIYDYENAALVWDNLVGQKGDKDEETERYLVKMRRAIGSLRIAKALLEIPEWLLGIDREELLRRCGLRNLKSKS